MTTSAPVGSARPALPEVEVRFYEELNDHLARDRRGRALSVAIDRGRSVKDLIESVGVPHTEVEHMPRPH